MEGRLQEIDLYRLIEALTERAGTWELRVRRHDDEAVILIGEGDIVGAKTGSLEGEAALFETLGWKEGRFRVSELPPGAGPS